MSPYRCYECGQTATHMMYGRYVCVQHLPLFRLKQRVHEGLVSDWPGANHLNLMLPCEEVDLTALDGEESE